MRFPTILGIDFPEMGTIVIAMGNDLADAIRAQLRYALLDTYGTLESAAVAVGMPYKTLYRHVTQAGKDRTSRVTLDFVLEVTDHLSRDGGISLEEIYRRARLSQEARNVRSSVDDEDLHTVDLTKNEVALAATDDDTNVSPDSLP